MREGHTEREKTSGRSTSCRTTPGERSERCSDELPVAQSDKKSTESKKAEIWANVSAESDRSCIFAASSCGSHQLPKIGDILPIMQSRWLGVHHQQIGQVARGD